MSGRCRLTPAFAKSSRPVVQPAKHISLRLFASAPRRLPGTLAKHDEKLHQGHRKVKVGERVLRPSKPISKPISRAAVFNDHNKAPRQWLPEALPTPFRGSKIPPGLFDSNIRIYRPRYIRWKLHYFLFPASKPPARPPLRSNFLGQPMLSSVQVVTTPTADTPGVCLLLHFPDSRYLFGSVSEGTQRVFTQEKIPLSRVGHIFLTGDTRWKNNGGLLGLILTVADVITSRNTQLMANKKKKDKNARTSSLLIHGTKNLMYMLATARRFVFRQGMPISVVETLADPRTAEPTSDKPDWQDDNIRVWNIPLSPDQSDRLPASVPVSPRKRSRDGDADDRNTNGSGQTEGTAKETERQFLEHVVKNMFNSDWRLDALVESTLHNVALPATLFVKDDEGRIQKYDGPLPGDQPDVPDVPVLVRKPWPGALVADLPKTSPSRQSLSYIVKAQPRRGKFDIEAATRLGVEKQNFKLLTQGQTVKSKDGSEVTPDMVVGKTIEGNGFAIVELDSSDYIQGFLERPEWSNKQIMDGIEGMYWNVSPEVVSDPRIRDFMVQHSSMRHTVFSRQGCANYLAMKGAAAKSVQCHRVDPDRFPLPHFSNVPEQRSSEELAPYHVGRPGTTLQLAPQPLFKDETAFSVLDTAAANSSIDRTTLELANAAKIKSSDPEFLERLDKENEGIPNQDAEIIPLGTGSALPSKYRNVSATLVRVPGYGNYLFDCGENTLGQMQRMLGIEETQEMLAELKMICISHMHADHHLGLASILQVYRDAVRSRPNARLTLAVPRAMLSWILEYARVEHLPMSHLDIIELAPAHDQIVFKREFETNGDASPGVSKVEAVYVDHCAGAVATVLTWPSGLKIAYSGDCRPSKDFVSIGKDATLLIHESTLDDELKADAISKKHCTMSEALKVARDMNARRVLLTHFSQRYPKMPNTGGDAGFGGRLREHQTVIFAFDQMRVRLGDFKKAELFLPALRKLFEEEEDDDDRASRMD